MKAQMKRSERTGIWVWRIIDAGGIVLDRSFGGYMSEDVCRADARIALRYVKASQTTDGWVDA